MGSFVSRPITSARDERLDVLSGEVSKDKISELVDALESKLKKAKPFHIESFSYAINDAKVLLKEYSIPPNERRKLAASIYKLSDFFDGYPLTLNNMEWNRGGKKYAVYNGVRLGIAFGLVMAIAMSYVLKDSRPEKVLKAGAYFTLTGMVMFTLMEMMDAYMQGPNMQDLIISKEKWAYDSFCMDIRHRAIFSQRIIEASDEEEQALSMRR